MTDSYIAFGSKCGICRGDTVCPIKYQCQHMCCMMCLYKALRINPHTVGNCGHCGECDIQIKMSTSPVYNLENDIDYLELVQNMMNTNLNQVDVSELQQKRGKKVLIFITEYFHSKQQNFNRGFFGTLESVDLHSMYATIDDCFFLNISENSAVYPTSPSLRKISLSETYIKFYAEEGIVPEDFIDENELNTHNIQNSFESSDVADSTQIEIERVVDARENS